MNEICFHSIGSCFKNLVSGSIFVRGPEIEIEKEKKISPFWRRANDVESQAKNKLVFFIDFSTQSYKKIRSTGFPRYSR